MSQLLLATTAFALTHFVSGTPLRPALVRRIGEWPYRGLYSLIAIATLGWMIWAYANTPRDALLWPPLPSVPLFVMPFAFILVVTGYWRNPTMVGADRLLKSEDAARGMIRITRHPLMWGIMLWAAAHIAARADLKSLIFFGGLLLVGLVGTLSQDRRKARTAGAHWRRFAADTSHIPFLAVAQGRNRVMWREIGWTRPTAALALYFIVLRFHP